jgi:pimeloyl-ACP methyl ester carboxylesterase
VKPADNMKRRITLLLVILAAGILLVSFGCATLERKLLFFPSHRPGDNGLEPWTNNGQVIGYSRKVESPKTVWLMTHGNGGQAADRVYALTSFAPEDSVFILEYPGYGLRSGTPARESINRSAKEAYLLLRKAHPGIPVCVAGESIGSGPACSLATLATPPDKLVLIVPFDKLSLVAKDHFPSLLVGLILADDWDNGGALSQYKGPVDIFGAEADTVIPVGHAKALAAGIPAAKFVLITGGHNDWSHESRVSIRNP